MIRIYLYISEGLFRGGGGESANIDGERAILTG